MARPYPGNPVDERFEDHLSHPRFRGHEPPGAHAGAAGGAACGDLVRLSVAVQGDRVVDAGFDAAGCGAAQAAGSAAVELVRGAPVLDAARVGAPAIADALGGLSPGKLHAADLASDALHRALGEAVRVGAAVPPEPARTLVAMSGGVDSAVAALLAARSGAEVATVTVELWADPEGDPEGSCCSAAAVRTARALAHRIGLPHFTLDLREAFRAGVVDPYLADHAAGLTPNPCVRCNGSVRLDAMVAFADRIGTATLQTGHYARVAAGLLRAGADAGKDQSYMLAGLDPATLARLRFPLGELTKAEVRALAEEAGLPVAHAPESQDLCFLAGVGKAAFLARHGRLAERPGAIVDRAGTVLGEHRGHHRFTVGQRRGLGIGAREPLHVLAIDAATNTVTVGPRDALRTREVRVRSVRLHADEHEVDAVRLRYRSRPVPCRLRGERVELLAPADVAAPGQTAVFLGGDAVLGSATIAAAQAQGAAHLDSVGSTVRRADG
jgi:tRNA-specific 2-thiouridylase